MIKQYKAPNLGVSNFQTNPISIHLGFAPASLSGIEKHLLGLQVSRWLPQVEHELLSVRNVSPFQNANMRASWASGGNGWNRTTSFQEDVLETVEHD